MLSLLTITAAAAATALCHHHHIYETFQLSCIMNKVNYRYVT